ncbi:hypothetical protein MMC07_007760 [Pseudocyphellaria aurata]|nr:hypothetical protein [Pseudocyphellaria aurata]
MSYGVFFEIYDDHRLPSASDLELGLIGGTQSFLVLLLSIVVGRLLDVHKHRWISITGLFLVVLALLLLSVVGQNYALIWLTNGFVAGVGMSCFFMYSSHNAIQWFPLNAYFATGVTSAGAGVGGVVYPPTMSFLVSRFGFSLGIQILAGITGVVVATACALGIPKPDGKKMVLGPILKADTWFKSNPFKNRSYCFLCAAMWLSFAGYYPLVTHIAEWAEPKRKSNGFPTYWFITILNGTGVFGRVGTGILASRWENPITIHGLVTILASLLVMVSWPLASNETFVTAFCVLLGILVGSMFGLPASSVAYLIPAADKNHIGTWTGMMWSSCAPFSLAGPLVGGALRQRYGQNAIGFWAGLNFLVASVMHFLALRTASVPERKGPTKYETSLEELPGINTTVSPTTP